MVWGCNIEILSVDEFVYLSRVNVKELFGTHVANLDQFNSNSIMSPKSHQNTYNESKYSIFGINNFVH